MTFKDKVYYLARKIPKGKVATYGQLAKLTGNPKAARAVGVLMKHNPTLGEIPCHRVVSSKGELTGFSAKGGVKRKKELLQKEGVKFKGNIVDLSVSLMKM